MKTVIVFDTEDQEGMKNTLKIVEHLATAYLGANSFLSGYKVPFGKIELIKEFRNYAVLSRDEDFGGLRHAKGFVEKIIAGKKQF